MTADVDVVVPVRDGGRLLRAAVDSVLGQDGPRARVIVVDDGSRDGAPQRLPRDPRLLVVPNRGRGECAAHNTALALATAPYVARQDADDVSLPGRLRAQAEFLDAHRGIGLVATAFEVLVGRRVVATMRTLPGGMLQRNRICAGSTMVRRDVLRTAGGYREQFVLSSDYDTWLRCSAVAGIALLPVVGYRYRLHARMSTIRLAAVHPAYSELAKASARARLDGVADPADDAADWFAARLAPPEEQRRLTAEVAAWWAREFAALGSRRDALTCVRGAWRALPVRRRLVLAAGVVVRPRPQTEWS